MNIEQKLISRVDELVQKADYVLASTSSGGGSLSFSSVNNERFSEFRNASLSFILNLYGENHPYYKDFNSRCARTYPGETRTGRGILNAIKSEIEQGWVNSLRNLISAEIFTDFIEMAEHLLEENYKDPAAVMIGSVLEEHLRQLCSKSGIDIAVEKNGKEVPKRADLLNAELTKSGIYNKLDQKNVTALLDLRNKAAHGQYSEYTKEQVELMLRNVMDFISRNGI
tara:strand:+ start:3805 stop:4482 length:678 start_codon:yes stop_codon:yes gene_type:complete